MGMIDAVWVKANLLNFQHVTIQANLMAALSLFEIRKIYEAEVYLNKITSLPEDEVGHYILWPVECCKTYICWMKGDYKGAFEHVKRSIEHARFGGRSHHNG